MKYFKRELLSDSETNEIAWSKVLDSYGEYVSELLPKLSLEIQEYVALACYHDEIVTNVRLDDELKSLRLDIGDNHEVEFYGVEHVALEGELLPNDFSDVWLYDEIEVLTNKKLEFRILFEASELSIVAEGVRIIS